MGLFSIIHTVVSQQPGYVSEPSYVIYDIVSGKKLCKDKCFIGVLLPETKRKNK